jgi:YVTN family beta-propeller protein
MKPIFHAGLAAAMSLAVSANAADYKILERLKMPDGYWDYGTSDLAKGVIYWVRSDHTDVIDTKTHKVTALKNTGTGHMAVVVEGTPLVVIPLRTPSKMNAIVDTAADKTIAQVLGGEFPDGATYDSFSKHVFVVNHNSSDVTEIDPQAAKAVATIPVGGGKLEFAASDGAGRVFVNVAEEGEIAVIDVKSQKVAGHYKMPGCKDASGLAFAAAAKLLVASCGNGVAKVLTAEGKEVASLPIGKGPDAVIYDGRNKVAFIPCGTDGTLEIIAVADATKVTKLQTLATQVLARSGAVDAQGRLYLMAAQPDPSKPTGGGGRPTPKDGTYEMLVIGLAN